MDTIIENIEIKELGESKFIRPFSIHFTQDGVQRKWDCIKAFDSVSCLLYHTQKDAFLFAKQFRPSLWYYQKEHGINAAEMGVSFEFCAGLCDKGISAKQTIIEEILEETGYATNDVRYITSSFTGLGFSANKQSIFYALIDESMKRSAGGGVDDEKIELCFVPREQINEFLLDETKPKGAGALFGISWFLANVLVN